MFSSLEINTFRAFEKLRIDDLDRINLFVGRNNSGKTTILEAAEMLVSEDSSAAIVRCAKRRGEMLIQREENRPSRDVDISHLFHGHDCDVGAFFSIQGQEAETNVTLKYKVVPSDSGPNTEKELFSDAYTLEPRLSLLIKHSEKEESLNLPLSISGGLSLDYMRRSNIRPNPKARPASFVRTETLDTFELQEFWDSIALTEEESNVIETLKILEPNIDRIAFLSQRHYRYSSYGGIYVKLKHLDNRIPLGSLGDGIRHLLTMSLAVSRSRRGFVMIDEIDTGLHHSVMTDMWRVLIKTAQRLDVQVFATTHSLDCLRSLAWLYNSDPCLCHQVRLHRVDIGHSKTVVYDPEEIETAAQQHVELRG
jgi:AAA15 family ATPase/GTPase